MKRTLLNEACKKCPKPTQWLKLYTYLYHIYCFVSFAMSVIMYIFFTDLSDKATADIVFVSLAVQGICFTLALIAFIKLLTVNTSTVRFVYTELIITSVLSSLINAYHMTLTLELNGSLVLFKPSDEIFTVTKYFVAILIFYSVVWIWPNIVYFHKRKELFVRKTEPQNSCTSIPRGTAISSSLSDSFAAQFGFDNFDSLCQNVVYPIDKKRYSELIALDEKSRLESFAHFVGFRSARDMLVHTSLTENKSVKIFYDRLEQLRLTRQIMKEYKE